MTKTFTADERIRRVWDIELVKELMNTRVYYIAGDKRAEELADLWVQEPENQATASYGSNWGYYTGMDNIRAWYVDAHNADLEKQAAENGKAVNQGNMYARPVTTGLVELAEDGKTAKGLWYILGQVTKALPDGTADARWILGKLAADFVKEGDSWRIWHLVDSVDVDCEAGKAYDDYPVFVDWSEDGGNPVRKEFGTPTIEKLTHDVTFNWWDNYPPMPPKYKTFTDDISYGPEGHRDPENINYRAQEGRNWQ